MTPIITGPGSYRTREGERVEVERSGPDAFWNQQEFPWRIVGSGKPPHWHTFKPSGRVGHCGESPYDIVGRWIDDVRIQPIPADFRPIPGRHKAVRRDGKVCEVRSTQGPASFSLTGDHEGAWGFVSQDWNDGEMRFAPTRTRHDIIAFIDTKPDHTPTTKETPMPTSPAPAPFTSIDQIKVGMRVRIVDTSSGANPARRACIGSTYTVARVEGGVPPIALETGPGSGGKDGFWWFRPEDLAPADESPLAFARAEVARLEAEEVAAKALASLPEPLRKCHEYLVANPDAFGCQRKHVVAIVEALTGGKLP